MKEDKQKLTLDRPTTYESKCQASSTRVGQTGPGV